MSAGACPSAGIGHAVSQCVCNKHVQVINSWSYKELQRFCKAHGLLAIGKTDELRDRVKRYFCTGSVVDVIFDDDPSQPRKICRGVITQMLLNE